MAWPNILLAGLAGFAIGALWYGPLFGKKWMRLSGITKEQVEKAKKSGRMPFLFLSALFLAILMAWVLSIFIEGMALQAALGAAALLWLGLVVPATLGALLWEGRPLALFAITGSNALVQALAMAAILSLW